MVRAAGAASDSSPHHQVFDELRERLRRAHGTCEQVDEEAWADYVTRLDRGLDELTVEVARSGELPARVPGRCSTCTRPAWRSTAGCSGSTTPAGTTRPRRRKARELADRAARHLDAYGRGEAARADVDRVMEDVRALAAT
jgi:hypothetical protein